MRRLTATSEGFHGACKTQAEDRRSREGGARPDASASKAGASHNGNGYWSELFSRAACVVAHWMGKPIAFVIATALVILWALTGPLFGYSDTWQLVINTSTTIVTFLMVFLIQNTQNRDTMALQLKLSELILAISEAENRFANAEDLSRGRARAAARGIAGAGRGDARRARSPAVRADEKSKLSDANFAEPDRRREHDQHHRAGAERHEGRPRHAGQVPGKPAEHRRDHGAANS